MFDAIFQNSYSRNASDWNMVEDNGRIKFVANKGGVKQRCSLILEVMVAVKRPVSHIDLRNALVQYSLDDIQYALNKMRSINVVRLGNKGWTITAKGHRILKVARG